MGTSSKKILAVFGEERSLGALISLEQQIHAEYFSDFNQDSLAEFLEYAKAGKAQLAVEQSEQNQTMVMGYLDIDSSHPLYAYALADELKRRGFSAAVVSEKARGPLLKLSDPAISKEKRERVLGDLVNMEDQDLEVLDQSWDEINKLE